MAATRHTEEFTELCCKVLATTWAASLLHPCLQRRVCWFKRNLLVIGIQDKAYGTTFSQKKEYVQCYSFEG